MLKHILSHVSLAILLAGMSAPCGQSFAETVPEPLPMLHAQDGRIVDAVGQPVSLRAENIGNWLAWEQWIQRFRPNRFFNQLGRIVGEGNKANRINLQAAEASERSGVTLSDLCWQKGITGFDPGDFIRFKKVAFNPDLGGYLFRYVQSNQVPGRFEIRVDAVDGPLLATIETAYTKGEECHIAEVRGFFEPPSAGRDVYVVAKHPNGACNAAFLDLSLFDIENKAAAEELYDLLVDNVDASVTLNAVRAETQSGVGVAYDCEPDGIGSYGHGDFIEFNNVKLPAGLTNLSILAATASEQTNYDGRFRVELTDSNRVTHLFAEVPLFNTGGWGNYDEFVVYTGKAVSAGTYSVKVTGLSGEGIGDVGNLHSLRFFKSDTADALIERYRDAYFTTNDLDLLKDLGINAVRIPFNYELIMNDAGTLLPESTWTNRLDWVVNECARRGMYCILDLHAAPGGQNDYEQCMRKEGIRNRLWYVNEHQNRLVKIWTVLARHFKGNPAVAGYDLLNEPAPWWHSGDMKNELPARFNQRILPVHRRLYEAIRAEDPDHLIIMEDNAHMTWNSRYLPMLPEAQKEGWSNIVYEIHSYEHSLNSLSGDWRDSDIITQKDVADENIRNILRFQAERKVPVFIGEFQPVSADNYDYALRRYNRFNIPWCHWNFKVAGWGDTRHEDQGWDYWGLQYKTNPQADKPVELQADTYETLKEKFAAFDFSHFSPHAHLARVFKEQNRQAGKPSFTKVFQTAFSAPDVKRIDYSWCGDGLTLLSEPGAFQIMDRKVRLSTGNGAAVMRLKSRKETEAHFDLSKDVGSVFSVDIDSFGGAENGAGAEVRLSFTRDLVTNAVANSMSAAVTACLHYDGSNQVKLSLWSKDGGTNETGNTLYESDWGPFSPTGTLSMTVTRSTAEAAYPGLTSGFIPHGQTVADWPEGGIAVAEVNGRPGQNQYAELDNLRVEYSEAAPDGWYMNDFEGIPDLMMVRALPDQANILRTWSASQSISSYIQGGRMIFLPNDENYQSVWLNLFNDYQNPLRLRLDDQHAAGIAANLSSFTQGRIKYCFLPEVFFGDIWGSYRNRALYVEVWREGTNIAFAAYRHLDAQGHREDIGTAVSAEYADGAPLAVQLDANRINVYYNRQNVLDAEHGVADAIPLYCNGVFPHLEFQNFDCTNAFIVLDDLVAVSPDREKIP